MSRRARASRPMSLGAAVRCCALGLALAGCGDDGVTEIVIEVRSDLAVPAELDAIVIEATGPEGEMASPRAGLTRPDGELPRTLTLVHDGGALGPVRAVVKGMEGGSVVVQRTLEMRFEQGARLRIVVHLSRACAGADCGEGSTCVAGACRPVQVRTCEYESRTCPDAGPRDAGPTDAEVDAPGDASPDGPGPGCALDDGIAGVASSHLPGDRLALEPRTAPPAGTTLSWSVEGPSGTETGSGARFVYPVVDGGTHAVTVTASEPDGCEAMTTFEGAVFEAAPATPALDEVRDMDARPGMAFLATRAGGWAATTEEWRNLGDDATSGSMVSDDLRAVAVLRGDALFMPMMDDGELTRADVAADWSTIELASVSVPAGADRSGRSMATPSGGDPGPDAPAAIAAGTKEDVVVYDEDLGGTLSPRTLSPAFEAQRDIAIGRREAADRGAVWVIQSDRIVNFALGVGSAVADSAELTMGGGDVSEAEALALDDRDESRQRLWICASDADAGGIAVHELDREWAAVTDVLPPPLMSTTLVCRDVAVGASADGWVATSTGLERFDPDGDRMLVLGAEQGLPGADMASVATAWDASMREVWVLAADGRLFVASADRMP